VGLATAFVALQQLIPLCVKLTSRATDPEDFSWDMFGQKLACRKLAARAVLPDGSTKPLNLELAFPKWSHLRRVLTEDRLQDFAGYVCQGLKERHGGQCELHLWIECQDAGSEQVVQLSSPERNWCEP
jgi:hypothetical protein